MEENWSQLLARAASSLGVPLTEEQLHLFTLYYREIITWNEKINLLSRSSAGDTLRKNFIDSLAVAPFLPSEGCRLLDMGSGGGFPGIPLKIAREGLQVSLLEASRKKTSFLKHVVRKLQLKDITVLHDRAENLLGDEACRGSFDALVSQATFKLPQLLALGAPFLAGGGVLIAMKSANIGAELAAAEPAAAAAGLSLAASRKLILPLTGDRRLILIYQKA